MSVKKKIRLRRNVWPPPAKTSREWLRQIRYERGMTQEQVAEHAEISRPYYVLLETGSGCKGLSVKTAMKIGKTLGFDWTKFFEDTAFE